METYLEKLLSQIRCKKARPYIAEEIRDHIECQIADNLSEGMTYEEAKKALNKIDLGIKDGGTQASEKYDAGEIIFQSEDKGDMIKKNTTIVVVMSSGVGEVSVPDVKGLAEASAINKLQDNGF